MGFGFYQTFVQGTMVALAPWGERVSVTRRTGEGVLGTISAGAADSINYRP